MKSIKIGFIALSVFALALVAVSIPTSTIGQSTVGDGTNYPPEFSPLRTSRPAPAQDPQAPSTKFVRMPNSVPNRYIVVLNDDVVSDKAALDTRHAKVTAIADTLARIHGGKVGFIYETALKGFSIELPNEAAAIALSENPRVKWVEEVARLELTQIAPDAVQNNPPWGLDAIDGSVPVGPVLADGTTNGLYLYNRTGGGVTAYVLDTGIRSTHQDFGGRASIAADFIAGSQYLDSCISPKPTATDNDCWGHGTHVAATIGGATYGAAKSVTIRSVKVCTANFYGCPTEIINAGVNWVTNDHNAHPSNQAVANMSLGGPTTPSMDIAVQNSINAGVTYVVSAGNNNDDARFYSPADVQQALTVASIDAADARVVSCQPGPGSNFGSIDLFAPGYYILSAYAGTDTERNILCGTSMASPHVAGSVALFLEGRAGMSNCSAFPKQGPSAALGGLVSTCPDRVTQFIKSNANLSKVTNPGGTDHNGIAVTSPNRLILTGFLLAPLNPIDNQRFFVWQHYADFLVNQPEPDEAGLNFWTGNITGTCGTGINDNNACTHQKRIDVSRAFWVAAFPSLFTNGGNNLTDNPTFVHRCYEQYLRRSVPDSDGGFQFWLSELNHDGIPANQNGINHLIDAFMSSGEYRQRFGQP